jgi:choline dehydrogenase
VSSVRRFHCLLLFVPWSAGCTHPTECADGLCPRPADASPYDFIVVGSGAGGGPLAARLARAGHPVLLLEAGSDVGGKLEYQVPAMHALSTEEAEMAWWFFVKHHQDPALDRADSKSTDEGLLYPRGSALGGSTAVNAMVTVLPSPWDWDRIATLTNDASWRSGSMDPYYDRVREWLGVEIPDPELGLEDRKITGFLAAAAAVHAEDTGGEMNAELGRLLAQDLNASLRTGETTGLHRLPLATHDGKRSGTRAFILDTVEQGHPLTVVTGAFVTRVLFAYDEPATAIGVEYVKQDHVYSASLQRSDPTPASKTAFAEREVILSAGAFNSPQLLMLSGIGDPELLSRFGIETRVAKKGVGKNLQDRYEAAVVSEFETPISIVERCNLGDPVERDPCLAEWQRGEGVYRTSGFLASVLMRSTSEVARADLQVFAVPGDARGYYPGYSKDSLTVKNRFSWLLLKAHTQNRDGTVEITSADPFQRPAIAFNYFDEQDPLADPDLLALVEGVKFVRRVRAKLVESFTGERVEEIWPGPDVTSDDEIARFVRRETWGHHACCSNALGRLGDPEAVLDSHFRVIGAKRLRVVDASIFPEIPGTFIAMPTFMVSEKAADVILEANE